MSTLTPEARAELRKDAELYEDVVIIDLLDALEAAEKRNAELESTIERECEKSRRVMSEDHQLQSRAEEAEQALLLERQKEVVTYTPKLFIDGNISPDDVEKIAAIIRDLNDKPSSSTGLQIQEGE